MAKKRKTLVKDFGKIVASGDLAAFQEVFTRCEATATEGYAKGSALHFYNLTDEMIRWLVGFGCPIDTVNTYNRTALHQMASTRGQAIEIYLELGADVNAVDIYGNTPLHFAAGSGFCPENVKLLLGRGAKPLAQNKEGQTPLERALVRATNMDIPPLVEIARLLLPYENGVTEQMRRHITRIGEGFEFYRHDFNPEFLPETDEALTLLYGLFGVEPVAKRMIFDGKSSIKVLSNTWQKQFSELWDLLVPGSGAASTVQGEVIRICGKVTREIWDNGAVNWSRSYKKLPQVLPAYCAMGSRLEPEDNKELERLANGISANSDISQLDRLTELVVKWVLLNPSPIALSSVEYDR